jgi:protein involved in ribonucleotide reduction
MKKRLIKTSIDWIVKLLSKKRIRKLQFMLCRGKLMFQEALKMNKALIIYFSKTGNTEKVAQAIKSGLEKASMKVTIKKVTEADQEDFYNYDLVCFGSPVEHSLPPAPVFDFLKKRGMDYRIQKDVTLPVAILLNKYCLVFCTYSGPHCGMNEALPVGKYVRQFFEHLGFDVKAEWYEVGEFHGFDRANELGKMGNLVGRPNDEDLAIIELKTIQLVRTL